jgi:hypothetical protein
VGLAIWLGDRVSTLYLSHGLDLERFQNSPCRFRRRSSSAARGVIVARHVDPDIRNRTDIEVIIGALKALCS